MRLIIISLFMVFFTAGVFAKGGGYHSSLGSGYKASKTYGYGTGSSLSHDKVSGYTTTKGKYVAPYTRTSKDSTQYNNFETKGNYNPYTHKYGKKTATH